MYCINPRHFLKVKPHVLLTLAAAATSRYILLASFLWSFVAKKDGEKLHISHGQMHHYCYPFGPIQLELLICSGSSSCCLYTGGTIILAVYILRVAVHASSSIMSIKHHCLPSYHHRHTINQHGIGKQLFCSRSTRDPCPCV